jgi:hypothetical protein
MDRCSIRCRGKSFCLRSFLICSGDTRPSHPTGNEGSLSEVKRPRREANRSPLFSLPPVFSWRGALMSTGRTVSLIPFFKIE